MAMVVGRVYNTNVSRCITYKNHDPWLLTVTACVLTWLWWSTYWLHAQVSFHTSRCFSISSSSPVTMTTEKVFMGLDQYWIPCVSFVPVCVVAICCKV
jgi:hypothetical protein